jgi:hypothetical protein
METFLSLVLLDLGEFQKAPHANVIVHLCLEFARSGDIRSCAPMILVQPFTSGGSTREAPFFVAIS